MAERTTLAELQRQFEDHQKGRRQGAFDTLGGRLDEIDARQEKAVFALMCILASALMGLAVEVHHFETDTAYQAIHTAAAESRSAP